MFKSATRPLPAIGRRFGPLQQQRHLFDHLPGFDTQRHTIKKRINYPPEMLFQAVSNVTEYHTFVPYCTSSFVNEYDSQGFPSKGGLSVGFKQFNEKFVCSIKCKNNLDEPKLVEAESLSHELFEHLKMKWYIEEDPKRKNCSKMILHLDYKFANPIYNSASSLFAKAITNIMLKAFNERAAYLTQEALK